MKTIIATIMLSSNPLVNRFIEGGPFIMSLILICLLLSFFFLIRGFLNLNKDNKKSNKMISLTSDASLLGLVIGFLGSVLGLIGAFDAVGAIGDISQGVMAGGLKVSLLTVLFGSVTFILPRIGIIILRGLQNI